MITEAERSHSLLPASWRRPRKAENLGSQWCKFQSESKDLRTRSANGMGQGKWLPSLNRAMSPFLHYFVLFRP